MTHVTQTIDCTGGVDFDRKKKVSFFFNKIKIKKKWNEKKRWFCLHMRLVNCVRIKRGEK